MIIATYQQSCNCDAGENPGRVRLENARIVHGQTADRVCVESVIMDLVLETAPHCDACLREWEVVKE